MAISIEIREGHKLHGHLFIHAHGRPTRQGELYHWHYYLPELGIPYRQGSIRHHPDDGVPVLIMKALQSMTRSIERRKKKARARRAKTASGTAA